MQKALEEGRVTSRQLVEQYLQRIALYDDKLNATMAVNPNALAEADRLDGERRAGKVRGPLHGIPIALKDNVHTTDMPTTGGAIAFEGLIPPYEATLTKNLREAGAIILAKTVMTELANWVANGMPGNYSALAGYGLNPYDPRRDPRTCRRTAAVPRHAAGVALRRWPARAGNGRVELRHRHRRQLLGGERRHRNVGIDPEPVEPEHARGASSPRSDASAATASFRLRPIRTRPARWRSTWPTPRSAGRDGERVAGSERRAPPTRARRRPTATTGRTSRPMR